MEIGEILVGDCDKKSANILNEATMGNVVHGLVWSSIKTLFFFVVLVNYMDKSRFVGSINLSNIGNL